MAGWVKRQAMHMWTQGKQRGTDRQTDAEPQTSRLAGSKRQITRWIATNQDKVTPTNQSNATAAKPRQYSKPTNEWSECGLYRLRQDSHRHVYRNWWRELLYSQTAPVSAAGEWCDGCTCVQRRAFQRSQPIPSSHTHTHTHTNAPAPTPARLVHVHVLRRCRPLMTCQLLL